MTRFLPLLLAPALLGAAERPRVLMLFSNDRLLPANQKIEQGIRKAFASADGPTRADLFGEFLDAVRFPGPGQEAVMERYLAERHREQPPAACMCIGPQALEFLAERRDSLFPGVPVIVGAVTPPQLDGLPRPDGLAGRPMMWDIRPLLEKLPEIRPQVRRILVVTGAAEFDRTRRLETVDRIEGFRNRFEFEFSDGEDLETLKRRVGRLPEDALVFYLSYFKTPDGRTTVPREIARQLAAASAAPVVCVYDTFLGTGVLGGAVTPFEDEGFALGMIARRILEEGGGAAAGLEEPGTPRLVFDARALDRFGWKKSRLPHGSELRFLEPSLWEQHRTAVLAGGAMLLAQGALIIGLLGARARQRAAEVKQTSSESRFRQVFRGSPVPISIFRQRDGRIVDVNPAWEETMGVRREEAVGRSHTELRFAFEGALEKGIQGYLASGKALRDFEQVIHLPDGGSRRMSVSTELLDLYGEPCFVSMAQDVTDRHEAEEARHQLARASRLGMLGELTASIAHEVNQPLGAILSNTEAAEILMDSPSPPLDEIRAILADIRRDDLRAGEVIRQVRSLVSREEMKREALDPGRVACGVASMVRHDCKRRGITLACDVPENLPRVSAERVQLEQVLLNLLLNAMDAVCETGVDPREIRIHADTTAAGEVRISVSDSGPGIPEEIRDKMFESFFSTKSDGMGLGLALSKSIAESHGGRLVIHGDSASAGACFHLILPACDER
ncbi:MAG: PAS domain S-box protein [Akkermansiaceae bacterium]|nr:PAS domain S-box protein [Akkermansiaceae bacterium]